MKITSEDMRQWRTGLHAANPEQAKALVRQIDDVAAALRAYPDSDVVALAEACRRDSEIREEQYDRDEALNRLSLVLYLIALPLAGVVGFMLGGICAHWGE